MRLVTRRENRNLANDRNECGHSRVNEHLQTEKRRQLGDFKWQHYISPIIEAYQDKFDGFAEVKNRAVGWEYCWEIKDKGLANWHNTLILFGVPNRI